MPHLSRVHASFTSGIILSLTIALCIVSGACSSSASAYKDRTDIDAGTRDLLRAAERGSEQRVRAALSDGVSISATAPDGRTALHVAAARGHDELVEYLIGSGAVVDAQDNEGNTPLHLAAMAGHDRTVRTLNARGASRTIRNNQGKTAAEVADADVRDLLQ